MEGIPMSLPAMNRRGWWLAIEFEKRPHGRKKFDEALKLLGAGERYDLILESGKTLARGIFDGRTNLKTLHRLIATVSEWTGSALHTAGGMLREQDIKRLTRMIACANGNPPCRSGAALERFASIGCHMQEMKIGLTGFTYPVGGSRPFWFSFYRACRKPVECYELDEKKLRQSIARSCLCPLHPQVAWTVAERLPKTLDLKTHRDFRMWMKSDEKITQNRMRLFPAVVPRRASRYNEWVENVILRDLFDHSLVEG